MVAPSEDVKALFRRFGGESSTYQEVVRERLAEESRMRWPMLGNIQPMRAFMAPSVHKVVHTAAVRGPSLLTESVVHRLPPEKAVRAAAQYAPPRAQVVHEPAVRAMHSDKLFNRLYGDVAPEAPMHPTGSIFNNQQRPHEDLRTLFGRLLASDDVRPAPQGLFSRG